MSGGLLPVVEVFGSIQGEGANAGRWAVFIRLAGCNCKCPFCDTDYAVRFRASPKDMAEQAIATVGSGPRALVVITGGEPSIHDDLGSLVVALHTAGFSVVAAETNGTNPLPGGIDWVTCSPKVPRPLVQFVDEYKLIMTGDGWLVPPSEIPGLAHVQHVFVQPVFDDVRAMSRAIDAVRLNRQWRLGMQYHKLLGLR